MIIRCSKDDIIIAAIMLDNLRQKMREIGPCTTGFGRN